MFSRSEIGARLTRTYVLALSMIALLAIGSIFLTKGMLEREVRQASLISLSGEQRMLAQRIAMTAGRLTLPRQWVDREEVRMTLANARQQMLNNHRTLVQGDPERGIPPMPGRGELHEIYFQGPYNLDRQLRAFTDLTALIMESPFDNMDFYRLDELNGMAQDDLPTALAAAASYYTQEAKQGIEMLLLIQSICLAAILAGLVSVAVFLFRPMVRRVEETTGALEEARRDMEHSALHDALTGLPNRRYLNEHLDRVLANARRNGQIVGVLHLDLDKFKQINDTLGHAAGDAVLVAATKVMLSSIRTADFVARIGGDEFVIVAPVVNSVEGLGILADRLIERISVPIPYEGHMCEIGTSIGIALATPASPLPAERLIMNADLALYESKNQGRGRYSFFPGDEQHLVTERTTRSLKVVGEA